MKAPMLTFKDLLSSLAIEFEVVTLEKHVELLLCLMRRIDPLLPDDGASQMMARQVLESLQQFC
jgi:hypothetical protein